MVNFELRQLSHFVAIAEAGSYRRAASRLFTAQPALSVSIRKLEEALGVQVFVRGNRGVALTPAGQAFLADARGALGHAIQGRQSARMAALGEVGLVRLGFVGSAAYGLLPQNLPRFLAMYPSARLELVEGTTVSTLDKLRADKLDIGIVRTPIKPASDLDIIDIQADDLIAAVPKGHPLAGRRRIGLAELRHEPFILFSQEYVPGLCAAVNSACNSAGFTPRLAQEATQAQTMIGLVGSGLGVALVPGVIAAYTSPQVKFLALSDAKARSCLMVSLAARRDGLSQAAIKLKAVLTGFGVTDELLHRGS